MSFSWNRTGGNGGIPASPLSLPTVWPEVNGSVTKYRNTDISYYSNVVTMSYSHVWWNSEDWCETVDWMALSGINLALAYTGTEEIERKVFGKFGIDNKTFASWSNAPAWVSWSRGQSMHGVGTRLSDNSSDPSGMTRPLSQAWMQQQWNLQRQILTQMRAP